MTSIYHYKLPIKQYIISARSMDIILTLIPENDNITFFLGRRLALETTYEL